MRQVTHADLGAQAMTASRVGWAERYLDANPPGLTVDGRSRLIWNLLNGQVTIDALKAVLGLLRASDAGALGRLWDERLSDRLESEIPFGHELRAELDEFTA